MSDLTPRDRRAAEEYSAIPGQMKVSGGVFGYQHARLIEKEAFLAGLLHERQRAQGLASAGLIFIEGYLNGRCPNCKEPMCGRWHSDDEPILKMECVGCAHKEEYEIFCADTRIDLAKYHAEETEVKGETK